MLMPEKLYLPVAAILMPDYFQSSSKKKVPIGSGVPYPPKLSKPLAMAGSLSVN
jgi:hypothetical protein